MLRKIVLKPISQLPAEKIPAPISHLNTKTWEDRVKIEKYQSFHLKVR